LISLSLDRLAEVHAFLQTVDDLGFFLFHNFELLEHTHLVTKGTLLPKKYAPPVVVFSLPVGLPRRGPPVVEL